MEIPQGCRRPRGLRVGIRDVGGRSAPQLEPGFCASWIRCP